MMLAKAALLAAIAATPVISALLRTQTQNHPEVYGWCDFNWANAHQAINIQCGAEDRKCDGHAVYAILQLYSDNGKEKELAKHKTNNCGTRTWDNTKHSWDNLPRSNLAKARVKACVEGTDKCYYGNWVDNPYE